MVSVLRPFFPRAGPALLLIAIYVCMAPVPGGAARAQAQTSGEPPSGTDVPKSITLDFRLGEL